MPRVDQFVPSFSAHDAIGNHVLQLRSMLRRAGFESDVYFEHLDPRLVGEARPYQDADRRADPDRLVLYHASTDTDMNEWLIDAGRGGQAIVVDYHNMTPAEYFSAWEPRAARSMQRGRRQLAELAPHVAAGVADSEYNARELAQFGVAGAAVCPILLDLDDYHRRPDPEVLDRLGDGPLWLFVGRLAPNKCQHDVIAAFAAYKRLYEPAGRLALAGGATSPRYQKALEAMIDDLDLSDSVELVGSVPFTELLAYFHRAGVFVCLSEHEGFCVPVIEAMELGVPVVAYSAAAVTETVADAGVLLGEKHPVAVATAVRSLLADGQARADVVARGRDRAATFRLEVTSERWMTELHRLLGDRSLIAGGARPPQGARTDGLG